MNILLSISVGLILSNVIIGISLRSIITLVATLVVCFVFLIVYFQESMMYIPQVSGFTTVETNPEGYRSPSEYGIEFEDVRVETSDGEKIHLWYLHSSTPKISQVFLECHGNAGNMGLRLPSMIAARKHLNVGIVIFDYRGFGASTGVPGEAGFLLDLSAVHDWLLTKVKASQIILHGRSVGGSLVIQHAARRPSVDMAGVLAENTFISISRLVDTQFPYLRFIKKFVLRLQWDTLNWLESFPKDVPLMLISSVNDEIVPHEHRLELYEMAKKLEIKVHLEIFSNAGHNDVWVSGNQYWASQDEWMKSL